MYFRLTVFFSEPLFSAHSGPVSYSRFGRAGKYPRFLPISESGFPLKFRTQESILFPVAVLLSAFQHQNGAEDQGQ